MFFKRILLTSSLIVFLGIYAIAQVSALQTQLENLKEVVSVKKIDNHTFFNETFEIMVEQLLDHKNPAAGKFSQRVFLSDFNKYSPVVFITEGYSADYASRSTYINELSEILQANQLVVEHRYFGQSVPEGKNWDYLTIENASSDLYRIEQIFKKIYNNKNKWIATGISKGGQATIAFKAFYPNAVDIWIPYVGPVNFAVEDKRMQEHISKVGTAACRKKVEQFQLSVLKNRDAIQPLFDSLITANKYKFHINNQALLDYCILEYSFAFWQWGTDCNSIPADSVGTRELYNHLVKISGPDYFDIEKTAPIKAFFIQAAKEFGYYSYNTKPFKEYLTITSSKGYINEVFLADEPQLKFNKKTSSFIAKTIQKDGENMFLIYGEYDPWTAGGIIPGKKCKAVRFVAPNDSHRTRIKTMSYAQRAELYMLLEPLLESEIKRN